jgi:hypothetical protein
VAAEVVLSALPINLISAPFFIFMALDMHLDVL